MHQTITGHDCQGVPVTQLLCTHQLPGMVLPFGEYQFKGYLCLLQEGLHTALEELQSLALATLGVQQHQHSAWPWEQSSRAFWFHSQVPGLPLTRGHRCCPGAARGNGGSCVQLLIGVAQEGVWRLAVGLALSTSLGCVSALVIPRGGQIQSVPRAASGGKQLLSDSDPRQRDN